MTAPVSPVLCAPWATPEDVPSAVRESLVFDDVDWERFLLTASELLYMLSGRRWRGGGCTESATLRSIPPDAGQGVWPYHRTWGVCACWEAGYLADAWLYPPTDYAGGHVELMAIRLPRSDISAVTEVTYRGDVMDPSRYRLTKAGWLERVDGGSWVMCMDSTVVSYAWGKPPPAGGRDAAVVLATEFAKDAAGRDCALPSRVTSVTRQGISFAMIDPMTFLPKNQTGVYRVDLWLQAVNPGGRTQRSRVYSPDLPTAHTS